MFSNLVEDLVGLLKENEDGLEAGLGSDKAGSQRHQTAVSLPPCRAARKLAQLVDPKVTSAIS